MQLEFNFGISGVLKKIEINFGILLKEFHLIVELNMII